MATDRKSEATLDQRLYSITTAAKYLGLSPWTIREMIWRGDLPSVRMGRRVMLDLDDLNQYIAFHKTVAPNLTVLTRSGR